MLILASQSPRRREILANAGLEFRVCAPAVEELRMTGELPQAYVRRLAQSKVEAIPVPASGDIVLGADTVVVIGGDVLEKPRDDEDAARMLRQLSGRDHRVITGICLRSATHTLIDSESTLVRFTPLSCRDIEDYVRSGECTDKAGAYAIQGLASKFITGIEGCYFNVVGLPIALVYRRLKELQAPGSL